MAPVRSSSPATEAAAPFVIDPRAAIGAVRLTVSDLERSRAFYEQALGLRSTEIEDGTIALGTGSQRSLIELHADRSAPKLDRRACGLFHLAVLVPSRQDLAFALGRLAHARWPLDGASDHLVSEALYLSDPDGNGIEIYRDRPRREWSLADGRPQMATLALDLQSLAGELPTADGPQTTVPAETQIGHVHLQVSELERTEAFYHGVLGFEVMIRSYPGALFVSAGGYHHHIGLNTWHSAGCAPPREGAVGLRSSDVELPGPSELDAVLERIAAARIPVEQLLAGEGHLVRDPSGNALVLRSR